MKRRRMFVAAAVVFFSVAAVSAELSSAGASGPGTISRADAVAVVAKVDALNSSIESRMVANGASVNVNGSERSFTDPGNQACLPSKTSRAAPGAAASA
jgi:hypothetical protein